MQKLFRLLLVACGVIGGMTVRGEEAIQGAFAPAVADPSVVRSLGGMGGYAGTPQAENGVRAPQGGSDMRYGTFWCHPWRQQVHFVVYKGALGGAFDHAIVDLNLNRDLTDDKVLAVAQAGGNTADLDLDLEGKKTAFAVEVMPQGVGASFVLRPKMWMVGSLSESGKELKAALYDASQDGVYGYGDMLLWDRNGDGQFSMHRGAGADSEIYRLGGFVAVGSRFYVPETAGDGSRLKLDAYTGQMGSLTFAGQAMERFSAPVADLWLTPRDNPAKRFGLTAALESGSVTVPAVEYAGAYCRLNSPGQHDYVEIQMPKLSETFPKVAVVKVTLDKPAMQISVRKGRGGLEIGRTLALGGVVFSRVFSAETAKLERGRQAGPSVVIARAAKLGETVDAGHMEYG